jgi:hypothetical protein
MSHDVSDGDVPQGDAGEGVDPEDYGSLTVEDEPGTVDPAELAGTASDDDADVGYEPEHSEADAPGDGAS